MTYLLCSNWSVKYTMTPFKSGSFYVYNIISWYWLIITGIKFYSFLKGTKQKLVSILSFEWIVIYTRTPFKSGSFYTYNIISWYWLIIIGITFCSFLKGTKQKLASILSFEWIVIYTRTSFKSGSFYTDNLISQYWVIITSLWFDF